jgi:hypothetical protein
MRPLPLPPSSSQHTVPQRRDVSHAVRDALSAALHVASDPSDPSATRVASAASDWFVRDVARCAEIARSSLVILGDAPAAESAPAVASAAARRVKGGEQLLLQLRSAEQAAAGLQKMPADAIVAIQARGQRSNVGASLAKLAEVLEGIPQLIRQCAAYRLLPCLHLTASLAESTLAKCSPISDMRRESGMCGSRSPPHRLRW